ncbi:homeodomain GLABROUS 1 [Perilla frutescens var. hirtella]|nr:homeodomain GLABROUS 1 [Perilla frutescens var. hirtella]
MAEPRSSKPISLATNEDGVLEFSDQVSAFDRRISGGSVELLRTLTAHVSRLVSEVCFTEQSSSAEDGEFLVALMADLAGNGGFWFSCFLPEILEVENWRYHVKKKLGVRNKGFGGLNTVTTTLPLDFGSPLPVISPGKSTMNADTLIERSLERSMYLELALAAMEELVKIAQTNEPLWIRSLEGGREVLNHEEYSRSFTPCIGMKLNGFVAEASQETGMVIINSLALVETLMDWVS